jgi:hypothetical protein
MAKAKARPGKRAKTGSPERRERDVQLELDMADHLTRLRAIPARPQEFIRQVLLWLAAGVLLVALGWLTLGR